MNVYAFNRNLPPDLEAAERRQMAVDSAHRALENGDFGLKVLPTAIRECLEGRVWEHVRSLSANGLGSGFVQPMTFDAFVTAPYPQGLGTSHKIVLAILESSPVEAEARTALDLWNRIGRRPAGNPNPRDPATGRVTPSLDNIQDRAPPAPTGTSEQAGLRRLRKAADKGDDAARGQLDAVLSGSVSTHAACLAMGWRKPTATVRDDVESLTDRAVKRGGAMEALRRAWRQASMEEQEQFLTWASNNMRGVADNCRGLA